MVDIMFRMASAIARNPDIEFEMKPPPLEVKYEGKLRGDRATETCARVLWALVHHSFRFIPKAPCRLDAYPSGTTAVASISSLAPSSIKSDPSIAAITG